VETGPADGDAADPDRPHDRHGGEGPRSAYLDVDPFDDRGFLTGGELAGQRPAGSPKDGPQLRLEGQFVDLEHHPVDFMIQLFPLREEGAISLQTGFDAFG